MSPRIIQKIGPRVVEALLPALSGKHGPEERSCALKVLARLSGVAPKPANDGAVALAGTPTTRAQSARLDAEREASKGGWTPAVPRHYEDRGRAGQRGHLVFSAVGGGQ